MNSRQQKRETCLRRFRVAQIVSLHRLFVWFFICFLVCEGRLCVLVAANSFARSLYTIF